MGFLPVVGCLVSVAGEGVGTVHSVSESTIRVRMPGDTSPTVEVPIGDAERHLRRPIERARAEAALSRLCLRIRAAETLPAFSLRSSRHARSLSFDQQVEALRLRARKRGFFNDVEVVYLEAAAKPVFAEVAAVLGVPVAVIVAAVRTGNPRIEPPTQRPLPAAPPPPVGAVYLRSFWLGAVALVGEHPTDDEANVAKVKVQRGAWHAYRYDTTEEEGSPSDAIDGIVAVHHAREEPFQASLAGLVVATLLLEGNDVSILDADALKDPFLNSEQLGTARDDEAGYSDRGVASWTWAAGRHQVFADKRARATMIFVRRVLVDVPSPQDDS